MRNEHVHLTIHFADSDLGKFLSPIKQYGDKIMSVISNFIDQQNKYNDEADKAMEGIQGDIQGLMDMVAKLQESQLTDADKAALDKLQDHAKSVLDKLNALNDLNQPAVPEEPANPEEPAQPEEPADNNEGDANAPADANEPADENAPAEEPKE